MALTPAEAERVEAIIAQYESVAPPQSLAAFMRDLGESELLAALELTMQETGDATALQILHAQPDSPDSRWQSYVDEFDAPTEGGPWALNRNGRWFTVTNQAPGGKVGEYQGRLIYIPPLHDSVRVSEYGGYGGRTDNELRWTDQKFRMVRAAMLGPRPFYNVFFKVAPRGGGPLGAGRAFQTEGRHYDSEGGELYPELTPADSEARTLNEWWRLQDFGGKFTGGYQWGQTLNWLRVFTGPDGYRHYKAWSESELREYMGRWFMAAPGRVCTPQELNRYISDSLSLQKQRQAAQTEGDYSLHWAWPIGPLNLCQESSASRRMDNLRKVAAVAAIVVTAMYAPQIALKMKTFLAKIGPKIAATAKAAGGSVASQLAQGKKGDEAAAAGIQQILMDPGTQRAIASGELPPPPSSTADPAWQQYAGVAAEWLMTRELDEQRRSIVDAQRRDLSAADDLAWMQANQSALQAELLRARREIERVAAGQISEDQAAENIAGFAGGGDAGMLALVLGGGALLALVARN